VNERDLTSDEVTFRADPGEVISYVRIGKVACGDQATLIGSADRDVVVTLSGSGYIEHSGSQSLISPGISVTVLAGTPYTITSVESELHVEVFGVSQTPGSAE
jgi:mannose-6-phosphate isomerase-like protein (cupin superfamily)